MAVHHDFPGVVLEVEASCFGLVVGQEVGVFFVAVVAAAIFVAEFVGF